tara:strand:+ start:583 stop:810 length:228 start_codon:yes stop_codon:yes gene_type:complete
MNPVVGLGEIIMTEEDSNRVSIIRGHQRDGGYLYEHVRMDIEFLLNKIERSEAEVKKLKGERDKLVKTINEEIGL